MPNHVRSVVEINGTKKSMDAIRTMWVRDDDGYEYLDFDKIIPETPDVKKSIEDDKYYPEGWEKELDYQPMYIFGNEPADPAPYWYEWHCHYWGTKWNSYEGEFYGESPDKLRFSFLTAWSVPQPIFEELVRKFHNVKIKVEYADEDYGNNCGILGLKWNSRKKKVEVVETSMEGNEMWAAMLHNGWTEDEYYDYKKEIEGER